MIWIFVTTTILLAIMLLVSFFAIRAFNERINQLESLLANTTETAILALAELSVIADTPVLQDDMIVQQLIRSIRHTRDTMATIRDAIQFDLNEENDEDEE